LPQNLELIFASANQCQSSVKQHLSLNVLTLLSTINVNQSQDSSIDLLSDAQQIKKTSLSAL
jgi:hypothetical protein